jgi:hypothetical protein
MSGSGRSRRTITWQDVLTEVRTIEIPAAAVKAPSYTLVNLDTTFYTEPDTIDRTLSILGYTVDITITPASFTWHWGDGDTTTTTTAGNPYPSTDVTHTYSRATHHANTKSLSVDVTYEITYRVDGGTWTTIPDTITIDGPTTRLPIRQASAVLVNRLQPLAAEDTPGTAHSPSATTASAGNG